MISEKKFLFNFKDQILLNQNLQNPREQIIFVPFGKNINDKTFKSKKIPSDI